MAKCTQLETRQAWSCQLKFVSLLPKSNAIIITTFIIKAIRLVLYSAKFFRYLKVKPKLPQVHQHLYPGKPYLKAQYNSPPCSHQFRSAALDIPNIIYFYTKQATLMRRSTIVSLPLKSVFPSF